jgi:hypothetical protein
LPIVRISNNTKFVAGRHGAKFIVSDWGIYVADFIPLVRD